MKMFRTSNTEIVKIVSLTSVLTCRVSCGHVVLKGLMLNTPPAGAALWV